MNEIHYDTRKVLIYSSYCLLHNKSRCILAERWQAL